MRTALILLLLAATVGAEDAPKYYASITIYEHVRPEQADAELSRLSGQGPALAKLGFTGPVETPLKHNPDKDGLVAVSCTYRSGALVTVDVANVCHTLLVTRLDTTHSAVAGSGLALLSRPFGTPRVIIPPRSK